ncbi:MAG: hypothetical protein ACKO7V_07305, partial [Bacteroidota bacterium]
MLKQISPLFKIPRLVYLGLALWFTCGLLGTACQNQGESGKLDAEDVELPVDPDGQADQKSLPVMAFDKKNHDFGIWISMAIKSKGSKKEAASYLKARLSDPMSKIYPGYSVA